MRWIRGIKHLARKSNGGAIGLCVPPSRVSVLWPEAVSSAGRMVWRTSVALPAAAQDKVRLLLDWFVNPDHGPLYVALEKGYFRDAGLDVEMIAPADPNDPPKLVAAGRADLCALARPHLADPAWTLHAAAARERARPGLGGAGSRGLDLEHRLRAVLGPLPDAGGAPLSTAPLVSTSPSTAMAISQHRVGGAIEQNPARQAGGDDDREARLQTVGTRPERVAALKRDANIYTINYENLHFVRRYRPA
mgnify:CR=1 FL=1